MGAFEDGIVRFYTDASGWGFNVIDDEGAHSGICYNLNALVDIAVDEAAKAGAVPRADPDVLERLLGHQEYERILDEHEALRAQLADAEADLSEVGRIWQEHMLAWKREGLPYPIEISDGYLVVPVDRSFFKRSSYGGLVIDGGTTRLGTVADLLGDAVAQLPEGADWSIRIIARVKAGGNLGAFADLPSDYTAGAEASGIAAE